MVHAWSNYHLALCILCVLLLLLLLCARMVICVVCVVWMCALVLVAVLLQSISTDDVCSTYSQELAANGPVQSAALVHLCTDGINSR